jgi:transcriptional regulator with XRE-family HTH domain
VTRGVALPPDKSVFANLGRALFLLRDLRGVSQAALAKTAGIGKSQLSKYENGRELPRLDSLEKLLAPLRVGYLEFFYMVATVDLRAKPIGEAPILEALLAPRLAMDLNGEIDTAVEGIIIQLIRLQRLVWEKTVLSPELARQENGETK